MKPNLSDIDNSSCYGTNTTRFPHSMVTWSLTRLTLVWLFFVSIPYLYYYYPVPLFQSNFPPNQTIILQQSLAISTSNHSLTPSLPIPENTKFNHIVFGIASTSELWHHRKNYVKLWWKPEKMRGVVWLDKPVKKETDDHLLPPVRISHFNMSEFEYRNPKGDRSAIRLTRIVSEMLKLQSTKGVRWFVMGDDDTFFVPDNLLRVLSKYDHGQYYYIGSVSESHLQNIRFSYQMAYGGAGFAISYPLAQALAKMQDRCIKRYPALYGSDDRIHACMSELGVPLTKEPGFHRFFDVHGNVFGLLTAHPVAPLVSIITALQKLSDPIRLDSAALIQQSICYDRSTKWTVSVSWGYAVQIFQEILKPRDIEIPSRTFLHWYRASDPRGYAFNTRAASSRNTCQNPFVYYLSSAFYDTIRNRTASEYVIHQGPNSDCNWDMPNPALIYRVKVYEKPDEHLWDKKKFCKVLPRKDKFTLLVEVGVCRDGEVIEFG
ncbi:hypothetical protein K2173_013492 [Erythroxylum novogranatense]|uniref:Transferring glycosyl group transferase n=1 Tax=Erythroxylum novogranatense TaxID=1862640 RepID=A0AAV8SAI1_9ROSI|nr:hypothetical protein K2173_013492 [Erythroxylum novogranatense]